MFDSYYFSTYYWQNEYWYGDVPSATPIPFIQLSSILGHVGSLSVIRGKVQTVTAQGTDA